MMPGLRCVPNRETQFTLFSVSFRKTGYRFRNTIGELLGFNSVKTATALAYWFSEADPRFNGFNYYMVQSDMVSAGIRVGPSYNQIISKVLVTSKPNTQVLYQPNNPTLIDATNLAGDTRRQYTFTLLDDSLTPIDTRGEYWSVQIRISYYEPVDFKLIN